MRGEVDATLADSRYPGILGESVETLEGVGSDVIDSVPGMDADAVELSLLECG